MPKVRGCRRVREVQPIEPLEVNDPELASWFEIIKRRMGVPDARVFVHRGANYIALANKAAKYIYISLKTLDDYPSKTVKKILIHELQHLQAANKPKSYHKRFDEEFWRTL